MIEIGKVNTLVVESKGSEGYSLKDPNSEDKAFMPARMAPQNLQTGESVEVFVYVDPSQKRMVATVEIPVAAVGEFARLRVVEVQEFGAFLDWGIEKDLLVPGNEQKEKLRLGQKALIRICLEEETNRIYGATKLGKHIENSDFDIEERDKVEITPAEETELGYRCIINKKFIGMIYHNEIFTPVEIGQTYQGVVKKIRQDGLVDAALQTQGARNLFESKDKVLAIIKERGGRVELTDKSSPEEISELFGMSKKSFKSAVGMLYKDRKIVINKDSLELVKK